MKEFKRISKVYKMRNTRTKFNKVQLSPIDDPLRRLNTAPSEDLNYRVSATLIAQLR